MELQNLFYLCLLLYVFGMLVVFMPSKHRVLAHEIGSVLAAVASLGLVATGGIFLFDEDLVCLVLAYGGNFIEFSLDNLNSFFLLLIGIAGFIASIYAYNYGLKYQNDKLKILTAEYNLFLLSMSLVVTAYNAFAFLLVWEMMAVSSFLLVNHEQYSKITWQAAYQYILMTNFGTALIMGAFFVLSGSSGQFGYDFFIENRNFLQHKDLIFGLALFGFAAKAGLVPLHAWLPRAHPIAPTHVSALMSGVMLKMAVYGFLRFVLDFLGTPAFSWGVATLFMGLLSGFVGALFLQMETDIKKILAYSSIEHLGIIFAAVGTGLLFAANSNNYIANVCYFAALIHSLNHSFIKTALFMIAGSVIHATHTANIEHMGGLSRALPVTSACALIGSMSICALPFTAGFLGEWLLLISLVKLPGLYPPYSTVVGIVAMTFFGLISAMSLGGFVRFFGIVFLGKTRGNINLSGVKEPFFMNFSMILSTVLSLLSGFLAVQMAHLAGRILPVQFKAAMFSGLAIYNTAFKPFLWSLLLVAIVIGLYFLLNKNKIVAGQEVWGCGTYPNARMQYSARGLSEPLRRVFSFYLYAPHEVMKNAVENVQGQKRFKQVAVRDVISERMNAPVSKTLFKISTRLRELQAGGIQLYISYILITIIGVLIYGTR